MTRRRNGLPDALVLGLVILRDRLPGSKRRQSPALLKALAGVRANGRSSPETWLAAQAQVMSGVR